MAEQRPQDLKTYRGNCHCKAFVFEVDLPEIKVAYECNCSICFKKGVLWQFPKHGGYRFVKGDEEDLRTYAFGNKTFIHKFCPTCGSAILAKGTLLSTQSDETPNEEIAINLRVLQNLDVNELDLDKSFNGASLPPAYIPPKFTGAQPTAAIEGSKVYTGSCHCGAVKIAVKTKPLDSTYKEGIKCCNCSICSRGAFIWVYTNEDQVSFEGEENLEYYGFNHKVWLKTFCRICGVYFHNTPGTFTDEQFAALTEQERDMLVNMKAWRPVTIRVLDGVDLAELDIERMKGTDWGEGYENP